MRRKTRQVPDKKYGSHDPLLLMQNLAHQVDIAPDLSQQRLEIGEFSLFTNTPDEIEYERLVVQVGIIVEQVGLYG
jgi:hypothetical protein